MYKHVVGKKECWNSHVEWSLSIEPRLSHAKHHPSKGNHCLIAMGEGRATEKDIG